MEIPALQRLPRFIRAVIILPSLMIAVANLAPHSTGAFAEDHPERKVRIRVAPIYPDMARKMRLSGAVRVQVVVLPNGNVKETKVIGGHPILVTAAVDAVKKWRFETASAESTGTVEFRFDPGN